MERTSERSVLMEHTRRRGTNNFQHVFTTLCRVKNFSAKTVERSNLENVLFLRGRAKKLIEYNFIRHVRDK